MVSHMLTYEQFRQLVSQPDKEAIMDAVGELTAEETRTALIMAIMALQHNNETHGDITASLHQRIAELEAQLNSQ